MSALGTVLGFAFLGGLDADQQNSLGNFLMLIAQVMITDATQQQLLDNRRQTRESAAQAAALEQRLAALEAAVTALKGGSGGSSAG